jgi:alkaline phosphatase D
MLKTSLKIVLALVLASIAFLFYTAGLSNDVRPEVLQMEHAAPPDVLTIAFGSCNQQKNSQDYWPTIGAHKPDVWLWLGDIVYSDTDDMVRMKADYDQQKNAPEYAEFLRKTPQVFGVWDDHDYGLNDGGKEWTHKDEAKEQLLDFLDITAEHPVRKHTGAYQSYTVGEGDHSVKIILLDTRYFRDAVVPPTQKGHRYGKNETGDVLGGEQWDWLEKELTDSPAAAHVIASSIQVLPQEHGFEKWENFPAARRRLLALLAATKPNMPLLLSGDRHLAEISEVKEGNYPIYEITASGLTHSYEAADEPNSYRISSLIGAKNYGLLHYVWKADGPELLAEVRGIDDDKVLASLSLQQNLMAADKQALNQLIYANDQMPDQLKPCPQSPNCVSTQTDQTDKKRAPIAYTGSIAEAKARLKKAVDGMKRTKLKTESENYLHYTFKTWPIPFIDDVEFLFDEEAKLIHYRSASRVGHSDLGANSKRMAKVVAAYEGID